MADKKKSNYWQKTVPPTEPEHQKFGFPENPVKIYKDGSIKANKYVDDNDRDISFTEFKTEDKVEGYYFERPLDDSTSIQFISSNIKKIFKTKITKKLSINNAFAVIKGTVKRFVLDKVDRFTHLEKGLKKEIKELHKNKYDFHYTKRGLGGNYYNRAYVDSTNFGPYNYDVKLKVTDDIAFINDLLVIKTGGFHTPPLVGGVVPEKEKICFVSPHEILIHGSSGDYISSGVDDIYTFFTGISSTGVNYTGTYTYSYQEKKYGITNVLENYSLSSKNIIILSGGDIKTEVYYKFLGDAEYSDSYNKRNKLLVSESAFSQDMGARRLKGRRKHEVNDTSWDGVIPSGVPFKVETWSTNPNHIGFVGEIQVVPVDPTFKCEFSAECEAYGLDTKYETSVLKGAKKATQTLYRKLNNYLVDKGIKNKNSSMRKYETLQQKNAQNIYEGLSFIRNENLQKNRGLKHSPLDSIYYYDGTQEVYGGSKLNANYSYHDVVTDISKSTHSSISPYTSQGGTTSSSEGSSTTNMGY